MSIQRRRHIVLASTFLSVLSLPESGFAFDAPIERADDARLVVAQVIAQAGTPPQQGGEQSTDPRVRRQQQQQQQQQHRQPGGGQPQQPQRPQPPQQAQPPQPARPQAPQPQQVQPQRPQPQQVQPQRPQPPQPQQVQPQRPTQPAQPQPQQVQPQRPQPPQPPQAQPARPQVPQPQQPQQVQPQRPQAPQQVQQPSQQPAARPPQQQTQPAPQDSQPPAGRPGRPLQQTQPQSPQPQQPTQQGVQAPPAQQPGRPQLGGPQPGGPQRPASQQPAQTPSIQQPPTAQQPAPPQPAQQRPEPQQQTQPAPSIHQPAPQQQTQQPSQRPQGPGQPGVGGWQRPPQQPGQTPTVQQPPQVQPGQRPPTQSGTPDQPRPDGRPGWGDRRDTSFEELRQRRRERVESGGQRTIIEEPDRVIVRDGGRTIIRADETERWRRLRNDARFERRGDEMRTIVSGPGGTEIITITDHDGRLLRRVRRYRDGREFVLIDNRPRGGGAAMAAGVIAGVAAAALALNVPPPEVRIPQRQYIVEMDEADEGDLYEALEAPPLQPIERAYTLDEIRYNANLRGRMRRVDINTINFEFGSWEVGSDQAGRLEAIATAMRRVVKRNPNEIFLIEGHTDAVGSDVDNLSLSDRRAESVAVILTQNFGIPAENLTTQGYGEQQLKVQTQEAERANRRVTVRRITPLLMGAQQ